MLFKPMNVFMKLYFACLKLIKIIEFLLKYRFICVIKQLTQSKSKFVFVLNSKSTISMILALQKIPCDRLVTIPAYSPMVI